MSKDRKIAKENPLRHNSGVNAAAQPLPRGVSGWQPKVFIKTFG